MRENYDFSESVKNPYLDQLNRPVTIPLDEETLNYFKQLSAEQGITYQTLIHLYLRDCAKQQRTLAR
jgi:predicted DNA binding CopG/RHH family protein